MLFFGSGICAATCLLWAVYFSLRGGWLIVGIDLATVAVCGFGACLTSKGRTRVASLLMLAVVYLVVSGNALFFDIPSPNVLRSIHQYLLALGVMSCLLTRNEPVWLRHGIPLTCLLTYAVFSASNVGWVTSFALPDTVRSTACWVNNLAALLTVYVAVYVIQNDARERNTMEGELRDALARGELQLHYQAQVANDRVTGAEALVRWKHPKRGMVSPGEFIPLAERTGLMLPIGDWVLRTACLQLAAWRERPETAGLTVAVNVSALQFSQADFVARVLDCVAQTGIDPSRLKIELTESTLAHDLDDIVAKMTALKARGIGFSLDDFGTGFSSLSYLRQLPLDQLKIDQSFIANMLNSTKEAAIVQLLISLGGNLGIQLIAEGVETVAQRQFLQSLGCDTYQGYLFSRPVTSADFEALLRRANGDAFDSLVARPVAQPITQAARAIASVA